VTIFCRRAIITFSPVLFSLLCSLFFFSSFLFSNVCCRSILFLSCRGNGLSVLPPHRMRCLGFSSLRRPADLFLLPFFLFHSGPLCWCCLSNVSQAFPSPAGERPEVSPHTKIIPFLPLLVFSIFSASPVFPPPTIAVPRPVVGLQYPVPLHGQLISALFMARWAIGLLKDRIRASRFPSPLVLRLS